MAPPTANPVTAAAPGNLPVRGPSSPLGVLAVCLVVISIVALVLCVALAFGWLSGYPESAPKNVTIYYQPAANPPGLTLYLHPPLNSIQARGESQLLAFQFTNLGRSTVSIKSLYLSSAGCFRMEPMAASGTPFPARLDADQSRVFWYRLSVRDPSEACLGQFPLVFLYTWQVAASTPPQPARTSRSVPSNPTAPVVLEQQSISTGPINVTTSGRLGAERFFSLLAKIIPLILLPVVLAAAGYLFQDFQERKARHQKIQDDRRDRQQKKQEQKLEVWKTILPGIIEAIRNHYIPMLSVMSVMMGEIAKQPPVAPNVDDILAGAVLFRSKLTNMVWHSGGFYFKSMRGEQICASLSNEFMDRCYALSGDADTFRRSAELLPDNCSVIQAKDKLQIAAPPAGAFATMCGAFKSKLADPVVLAQFNHFMEMISEILNYEANGPFYPQWYEERTPINRSKLTVPGLGLDPVTAASVENELKSYLDSLPNP